MRSRGSNASNVVRALATPIIGFDMSPFASILLSTAVALAGCTAVGGTDDAGSAAIAAQAGSFGVVRIDRESGEDPDVSAPRAVLGAAFVRHRGVDGRDVLGLLGGPAAEVETCRVQGPEDAAFAALDADVELLDLGAVEVRVAGTRTEMLARTFPDLAGIVGGVFYAEDATLGAARADVDEYVVSAEGRDLPSFEVVGIAPAGLAEILLDGARADAGIALERGLPVVLEWDAGDPRDRVEIEVSSGGQVVECVARDDGSFRLDGETLAWLAPDEDARVIVSRVRMQPFDATGLDASWVSIASSTTFRLAVL
jgi:hypothetical protein